MTETYDRLTDEQLIDKVMPYHCFRWPREEYQGVLDAFRRTEMRRFLEIGTFKGGTSALVKMAHPDARVVTVDLPDPTTSKFNPQGPEQRGIAFRELGVEVEQWLVDATHLVEYMAQGEESTYFDMVYVDGDHSPVAVMRDLHTAHVLLSEDFDHSGIILVHDYTAPEDEDRPDWTQGVAASVHTFCRAARYKTRRGPGWLVELHR